MPNFRFQRPGLFRGVLPSNRLMGMCPWIRYIFTTGLTDNVVELSIELLEWGRTFRDLGVRVSVPEIRNLKMGRFLLH